MLNHVKKLYGDSLYRNSFFLMASTAVMSAFGFVFWTLNARLYPADQVGLATTMISAAALISGLGSLGLGNGLIRFLPTSERKNNKINTAFTLSGGLTLVLGLVYILGISIFSPALKVLQENLLISILFITSTAIITIAGVIDTVFIAYRSAGFVLTKNTVFSLIKIFLPVILISFGAFGIYASYAGALMIAVIASFFILITKLNYLIKPMIDMAIVKRIFRFSFGSFLAGFIGGLPGMMLPILITNSIGPKYSAYFYMVLMISNLIYIIPSAVAQSLFAEGSHDEANISLQLKRAIGMILAILIPMVLMILIFGQFILLTFGQEYSTEGLGLLRLFALSSIFVSVNSIGSIILYIRHKVKLLVGINTIGAIVILGLSAVLNNGDLTRVGWAWLIGQGVSAGIYAVILRRNKL